MSDDIVAELDRWLAETVNEIYGPTPVMVQRARDEIMALRDGYTREEMREACLNNYNQGRAAMRERCARIADNYGEVYKCLPQETPCQEIAAAIRKEPS
jgi:hypothetical protein